MRHIVQYICAIVFKRIFWNNPATETVPLNAYRCLQGRGGLEKLVLRYVSTKWMAPNKCCGIFYVHWPSTAKYTEASPPARKMSLFSSIIITIILFYAIIRIYIILHIYLQVSETEGLADLHWVTGQSVLEKLIQYTSMEYLLRFQECSFKSSNLQLRIWMFLISRLQK